MEIGKSVLIGRLLWFEKEFLPQELREILSDVGIEHEDENDSELLSSEDDLYSSEEDSLDRDEEY